jgi:hypothetical protein
MWEEEVRLHTVRGFVFVDLSVEVHRYIDT